ncbi:MAG: SDR family oxidoreductase [Chloroflexi bacterium]|nr:SDR family oxidoreductase [Chloroflexota bacterium]
MGALDGKVALVTGARGGIGLATARALAAAGTKLVLGDVASLDETLTTIDAAPGSIVGVKLDVTSPADAEAAVTTALERFGRLDILVNNAGVGKPAPLADVSDELWDWIIDINLKGAFICARAAAPKLATGGCIVNVASLAGRSSSPSMACAYSASKAGLLGLTRHLAKELAPRGIRVTAVNPGVVLTPLATDNYSAELMDRTVSAVPLGRAAQPEEIAQAILFLASDAASYVTGASLDVNGGLFMA